MKSVYIIDPYYSDSHQYWAESIARNLTAKVKIFKESPIHWKWKMEGAAISLAQEINTLEDIPDVFLVTDFLNLGLFKSLLHSKFQGCRFVLYMHENQLTYPVSAIDSDRIHNRDNHYGFINYTSCLVADYILFNSAYHRSTFLKAIHSLSSKLPTRLDVTSIQNKSAVVPITINTDGIILKEQSVGKTIVWNHRWEYDKQPGLFLETMVRLKQQGVPFNLILLGKMDNSIQKKYGDFLNSLTSNIIHMGYTKTKKAYYELLAKGDIIISTSIHDFFGISILEGMYTGCRPILPYDLAYPELVHPILQDRVFYKRNELEHKLKVALNEVWSLEDQKSIRHFIDDNFSWENVKEKYNSALLIN